jgi:hypothetical protein
MRRGLWVGAVTFVVAAAMSVGYASILNKTAQAVLLDGELQDGFI